METTETTPTTATQATNKRPRRRRARAQECTCMECGGTFKSYLPQLARYCSNACRQSAHARREREAAGSFASHTAPDD